MNITDQTLALLAQLGVALPQWASASGQPAITARSPIDGSPIVSLHCDSVATVHAKIGQAQRAALQWRSIPAPRRGELVRLLGDSLRTHKAALGELVSLEAGKIRQEGLGEVQEMIDICDFAVGLSRQLYGLTMATERAGHRMMEQWHPLGCVGIISAFNFSVAVWAWNAALALVCGNALVWKPSEKTPLTALACQALLERAAQQFASNGAAAPAGLSQVLIGAAATGEAMACDPRIALVSATGSTRMGRSVASRVARRLSRSLLELGGNNAMVVTPTANLTLALPAALFLAVGTAGQRCTTLRRIIVHESIADTFVQRLTAAYQHLRVGHPLDEATLVGPLIDRQAFDNMQAALHDARAQGGHITGGQRVLAGDYPHAYYVQPAIFTNNLQEAEQFISAKGSDCGIANVNIGTSGAEIGGAFGGEKDTGGGRESGSDSWRNYMRRATNTINYSLALPLAQGIVFNAET